MSAETEAPELMDALWEVELQYDLSQHYAKFRAFMLDCLELVEPPALPETVVAALAVARRYQTGAASAEQLTAERVRCWEEVRERGHATELHDRETAALRAAMCVLYVEPGAGETVADVLPWFLLLVNRLEDHAPRQLALLRKHFPPQLA